MESYEMSMCDENDNSQKGRPVPWYKGRSAQLRLNGYVHGDAPHVLRALAQENDSIGDAVDRMATLVVQQQEDLDAYAIRFAAVEQSLAEAAESYRNLVKVFQSQQTAMMTLASNIGRTADSSATIAAEVAADRTEVTALMDRISGAFAEVSEAGERTATFAQYGIDAIGKLEKVVEFHNMLIDLAFPLMDEISKRRDANRKV